MVIIVMGEAETGRDSVGARVAESLGWEFLAIEKLCGGGEMSRSMNHAKESSPVELLRAALDSWFYEWRDVVLSCPVLTEKDQKHLRNGHPLVKFVYLKAADAADSALQLNSSSGKVQTCGPADTAEHTGKCDNSVLILASSMEMAEIVNAVLTSAVLQKPCDDAA